MRQYNEKKICFIICAYNEQIVKENLLYLSLLEIPDGYEVETLVVENNQSIAHAYNEAMNASDAKYKIYLKQEVLVLERKIIKKIVDAFAKNHRVGMLGLLGTNELSKDGIVIHNVCCGAYYLDEIEVEKIDEDRVVQAVDGIFIATQYDIPWREDITCEGTLNDTIQCLEFRKKGYEIITLSQNNEWIKVINGIREKASSEEEREFLCRNYKEFAMKNDRLRILFVHSTEIMLAGLISGFLSLGHEVIEYPTRININRVVRKEQEVLEDALMVGGYDLVVSYDFIASVSNACQTLGVKYYSWVYDSPLMSLYRDEAKNEVNYITVFDKCQYERLQNLGLAHLRYMPLGTEVNLFAGIKIELEDEKKYGAEVSFLGRLYEKRGFEELFIDAPQQLKEEAEEIVTYRLCQWDKENPIYGKASDELIKFMISKIPQDTFNIYKMDKRYFCESMKLARKANEYERMAVLNEVANHHKIVLYTKNTEQKSLENVDIRPWVNYLLEMPKVFYMSKINLNISSRSIESGIPQRVWDIMAVGGFCLTNYQAEIEEYFEIGKEIEVFHNIDELLEKIDYYLKHEKERVQIALNGYKKVKRFHSYEMRLKNVLEWIKGE